MVVEKTRIRREDGPFIRNETSHMKPHVNITNRFGRQHHAQISKNRTTRAVQRKNSDYLEFSRVVSPYESCTGASTRKPDAVRKSSRTRCLLQISFPTSVVSKQPERGGMCPTTKHIASTVPSAKREVSKGTLHRTCCR